VALTLTPALTVIILKREHKQPGRFFSAFNRFFARTTDRYENGVAWMVRRGAIATVLFLVMVAIAVGLWRFTPGSLVPDEDQGFYIAIVLLPDGSSLERTDDMVQKVVATVKENPNIVNAVAFTGFDFIGGGAFRNNAATIFFTAKHWDDRHVPVQALVGEFFGRTMGYKEGLAIAFNAPPIFALGATGGFEMHLQSHGDGGAKRLAEVSQQFIGRAMAEPGIMQAQMFWRPNVPQLFVDVDREKAKAYGVPIDEVFNALAATLGTYYVNDFNKYGRTWQVLMSSEARYRKRPDDVGNIYVRSERGEMVPVRSLARIEYTNGPDTLERFNNLPQYRVEVVRGPSSSLYGSNAFFGVINVITKRARDIDGWEFSFEPASFETYKGRATYGGTTKGVEMLFSGTFYNSAGQNLYFPEFDTPLTNDGIARKLDYGADVCRDVTTTLLARLD